MTWLIAPLFAPRSNGASPKPRRSLPGIFYLGKSRTHLKIDFSTVFVIPTKLVLTKVGSGNPVNKAKSGFPITPVLA